MNLYLVEADGQCLVVIAETQELARELLIDALWPGPIHNPTVELHSALEAENGLDGAVIRVADGSMILTP